MALLLLCSWKKKERKGDQIMASITINTNLASLTAQRNLASATTGMNTAMERLSTGYRINSGKDDAAGSADRKQRRDQRYHDFSAEYR